MKNSAKILKLHESYAQCPECGGTSWGIKLDGFGFRFQTIKALECETCGLEVVIKEVDKKVEPD